jgi:hypothetical protein
MACAEVANAKKPAAAINLIIASSSAFLPRAVSNNTTALLTVPKKPLPWNFICALIPRRPFGGCWGAIMRTSIAVAVLMMLCADAEAQTLTECGRSDGFAYYFPGGLVPADNFGGRRTASTAVG